MNSGRVTKNTAALFARQLINVMINLYTIRVLLLSLGINDFALFNVLMNVVTLASFITGSFAMITQRYFSFHLGAGDILSLKRLYNACFSLCIFSAVGIFLGLEIIGNWFLVNHLVIPIERYSASEILFQFIIFSFVLGNFSGFFLSIILAHEDMEIFAFFSILDAVLRLVAVLSISLVPIDPLLSYGLLISVVSIVTTCLKWIFCIRRYPECSAYPINFELSMIREMLGFAIWTVFGQITSISRNQAVTILINQAFNPATVAARALAVSVSMQVLNFSANFSAAIQPPITKAYASGDKEQMYSFILLGSKVTFFLVWLLTLPLIATLPRILALWLESFPEETVVFTRLALIENAIIAISLPLMTAVRATGWLRSYEISLGILQLLILFLSWVFIRSGYPAYSVYVIAILINLVMFVVRLVIVSRMTGLSVAKYVTVVLVPVLIVVAASSAFVAAAKISMPRVMLLSTFSTTFTLACIIVFFTIGIIYIFGLTGKERKILRATLRHYLDRLGSKK